MDNHFHFLVFQKDIGSIAQFLRRLLTAYVKYFNSRHDRVGYLFQSRYCARPIIDGPDWLNISRYIHRNPSNYQSYKYSSYLEYVGRDTLIGSLNTKRVLDAFSNVNEYEAFVGNYTQSK